MLSVWISCHKFGSVNINLSILMMKLNVALYLPAGSLYQRCDVRQQ